MEYIGVPRVRRHVTRDLHGCLGSLAARGMHDIAATPFSFAFDETVWRRIVDNTISAGPPPDPAVGAWLDEQRAAAARGEFVGAVTGVLTAATRP